MEPMINHIDLCGTMASAPSFSHENHGRRFYRFLLEVERLSGTVDTLPVLASWELLEQADVSWGERVAVSGQIRSFNQRATLRQPDNRVRLTGALCRAPVFRRTPLGREICDGMLAVNRPYHRTDYLPCIFWGRTARQVSQLGVGSKLCLEGRLQSRVYTKLLDDGTAGERTAYEISAVSAQALTAEEEVPV